MLPNVKAFKTSCEATQGVVKLIQLQVLQKNFLILIASLVQRESCRHVVLEGAWPNYGEVEAPVKRQLPDWEFDSSQLSGLLKHGCVVPVFTFLFPNQP